MGPRMWPVRFHVPPAVYNMATTSHGRCHGLPKIVIMHIFRQRFIKAENARCFYFSILEAGTQFTGPEGRCTVGFQRKVSSPCERKREEMPPFTPCMFPTAAITNEHKLAASNKTNVFSHSDGEQKSLTHHCVQSKVSAQPYPSRAARGASVSCLFQLWGMLAFLGLWLHHSQFLPLCALSLFSLGNFQSLQTLGKFNNLIPI